MTTPTATKTKNWPRLISTLERILNEPASWNQNSWASPCGTAYCFAGHAALMVGGRQLKGDEAGYGYVHRDQWTDRVKLPEPVIQELDLGTEHRDGWAMSFIGREALGLSYGEADLLFDGYNSIDTIYGILRGWIHIELQQVRDEEPRDWEKVNVLQRRWDELYMLQSTVIEVSADMIDKRVAELAKERLQDLMADL
jgi:hypothetical protein